MKYACRGVKVIFFLPPKCSDKVSDFLISAHTEGWIN